MSTPMFSGDIFPFSTRYLELSASVRVFKQIWLRYLFSSILYSNISNNNNDNNYDKTDNNSYDNSDNQNTS